MSVKCTAYYNGLMKITSTVLSGQAADLSNIKSPSIKKMCDNIADLLKDQLLWQAHKNILCELMCCCNKIKKQGRIMKNAKKGSIAEDGERIRAPVKQECIEEAIKAYRSLYNALGLVKRQYPIHREEVSFNMQFRPPVPIMKYRYPPGDTGKNNGYANVDPAEPRLFNYGHKHRSRGEFTAIKGRTNREYELSYRRPEGNKGFRWRRPDIIIMENQYWEIPYNLHISWWPHNPLPLPGKTLDPSGGILNVVEMKFPGDTEGPNQYRDYRLIAGRKRFKILKTDKTSCGCNKKKRKRKGRPQGDPLTDPVAEPLSESTGVRSPVPDSIPEKPPVDVPVPGTPPVGNPDPGTPPGDSPDPGTPPDQPPIFIPPPGGQSQPPQPKPKPKASPGTLQKVGRALKCIFSRGRSCS